MINLFSDKIKNICIISHVNPDGDTLGSASALYHTLTKINYNCHWFCDGVYSDKYEIIPQISEMNTEKVLDRYDLAISVDCADIERLGKYKQAFLNSTATICIDHHKTNTKFAQTNIVEVASSTSELIFEFIKDNKLSLDNESATALYIGISTDTGHFSFSSVNYLTMSRVAELMKYDVNVAQLTRKLYHTHSPERLNLISQVLTTLKILFNGKVAYIHLTKAMIDLTGSADCDTEGLIDYAREIENVKVAVFIREIDENLCKASLRSNGEVDVAKICTAMGGGGHTEAAGASYEGSLNDCADIVLDLIGKQV